MKTLIFNPFLHPALIIFMAVAIQSCGSSSSAGGDSARGFIAFRAGTDATGIPKKKPGIALYNSNNLPFAKLTGKTTLINVVKQTSTKEKLLLGHPVIKAGDNAASFYINDILVTPIVDTPTFISDSISQFISSNQIIIGILSDDGNFIIVVHKDDYDIANKQFKPIASGDLPVAKLVPIPTNYASKNSTAKGYLNINPGFATNNSVILPATQRPRLRFKFAFRLKSKFVKSSGEVVDNSETRTEEIYRIPSQLTTNELTFTINGGYDFLIADYSYDKALKDKVTEFNFKSFSDDVGKIGIDYKQEVFEMSLVQDNGSKLFTLHPVYPDLETENLAVSEQFTLDYLRIKGIIINHPNDFKKGYIIGFSDAKLTRPKATATTSAEHLFWSVFATEVSYDEL